MGRRIFGILVMLLLLISVISLFSTVSGSELLYPPWDINQDGRVDDEDVELLKYQYGEEGEPGWIPEDINCDGDVDVLDVSLFVSHYGEVYLLEPDEMIDDTIDDVEDMELPDGIENSIVKSLKNAKKMLENGDIEEAINKLNAIIRHIDALRGKRISEEDADSIIDSINSILDSL